VWRGKTRDRHPDPFGAGIEALLTFYAPDVVSYPAHGWASEEPCYGHDGIRNLSRTWTASVTDAALDVHEVRDLSRCMLILAELCGRARTSGRPVRQRFGIVNSDIRADGKVGRARFFLTWQEAREAAEEELAREVPAAAV
jgi:hypothetical protein